LAISGALAEHGHFQHWNSKRKKRGKRVLLSSLMLTPMVDMFSLLVIFLLQFFSASPDFHLMDGVELPLSFSSTELKFAPVFSLSPEEVYVDQKLVGKTHDLLKNPKPLADELIRLREDWLAQKQAMWASQTTEKSPEGTDSPLWLGEINFEAHKEMDSTIISQFMAILSAHHFGSIQLIAFGD
jgi:hypothetical protein